MYRTEPTKSPDTASWLCSGGGVAMSDGTEGWLRRLETDVAADDAGAVLRAWRTRHRQTQGRVAALLGTTQQHLSQIEKGIRPLSLDQRRTVVAELGIP